LAGNFVSNQLRLIFKQSQPEIPLTPHYLVASKTQVDAGAPAQATYKKFDPPPLDSFRRHEEERVLTEFKESVVEVWSGPGRLNNATNEEVARNQPGRPFEMPDGWNQVFGIERFRAAEGIFDANAAFHVSQLVQSCELSHSLTRRKDADNQKPKEEHTLPKLIQAAVQNVDADQRTMLLNHVVVTGGSSLLYKFNDRLNNEVNLLYPSTRNKIVAPGPIVERKYAAWIGGSILASLGSFHQLWISKKEYEEHGVNIVEKRCK
jgi:actin-related protein 4